MQHPFVQPTNTTISYLNEMDHLRLGKQLRVLREKKGLRLKDVEAVVGVSYQYVSDVETGRAKDATTLRTLAAIADASDGELIVEALPKGSGVLLEKLGALSPDQIERVERFIDALSRLDSRFVDGILLGMGSSSH